MKPAQSEIDNLLNDLVTQRFDEVDDLCRFVQNRLGKMDNRTAKLFWAGKEHMLGDRNTLEAYVKSEVENL